jgi:hypothetical protein
MLFESLESISTNFIKKTGEVSDVFRKKEAQIQNCEAQAQKAQQA